MYRVLPSFTGFYRVLPSFFLLKDLRCRVAISGGVSETVGRSEIIGDERRRRRYPSATVDGPLKPPTTHQPTLLLWPLTPPPTPHHIGQGGRHEGWGGGGVALWGRTAADRWRRSQHPAAAGDCRRPGAVAPTTPARLRNRRLAPLHKRGALAGRTPTPRGDHYATPRATTIVFLPAASSVPGFSLGITEFYRVVPSFVGSIGSYWV